MSGRWSRRTGRGAFASPGKRQQRRVVECCTFRSPGALPLAAPRCGRAWSLPRPPKRLAVDPSTSSGWEAAHGYDVHHYFYLTRSHAPPAFFPSPCPAHPLPIVWRSGPAGQLEDRMGPRDLTRTRPGATLAWMTVGTTRSHQQAARPKINAPKGVWTNQQIGEANKSYKRLISYG